MNDKDKDMEAYQQWFENLFPDNNHENVRREAWLAACEYKQKEIDELEQRLELANKVIEKLEGCVEFYADIMSWGVIVAGEAISDKHGLSKGCFDCIIYEDCELDVGGKLARATLKEVKELMKGEKHED